jgi:hypothetical protein
MSQEFMPATPRPLKNCTTSGILTIRGLVRLLRITFMSGPFLLFTERLSLKHAWIMIMLCVPALLLTAVLVIPPLLFTSPEQNAYFQFAKVINSDPTRLLVLALAGVCAVVALAVPATAPKPFTAIRS